MFGFFSPGPTSPDLFNARMENHSLRNAISKQRHEIEQILGKALGYPRFCDDQKNFPGSTEADGVYVGEHAAESLASEASCRIFELRQQLATQCDANVQEAEAIVDAMPRFRAAIQAAKNEILRLAEELDSLTCSHDDEEAAHQDTLRQMSELEQLVRNLLNDIADRHSLYKAAQFTCSHMRALAERVFKNGDVIRP